MENTRPDLMAFSKKKIYSMLEKFQITIEHDKKEIALLQQKIGDLQKIIELLELGNHKIQ